MANETKFQYVIELLTQGDTTRAAAELKKLEKAGTGVTSAFGGAKAGFAALIGVLGSAVIKESIDAFVEQERAVSKLNAALKSTGEFTPQLSDELQKLSEQMAETSLFADEEILNVIAKLTAMGAKSKDIERLTRATLDLATLMDGDLSQSARQMSLAIGGAGAAAFDRLRLNIDETLKPTEAFNAALIEIEKRAGGQSAEAVKSLGGQYEQLTKKINESKEALGSVALGALSAFYYVKNGIGNLFAEGRHGDPELERLMAGMTKAAPDPIFLLSSSVPGAKNPLGPPSAVTSSGLSDADRKAAAARAAQIEVRTDQLSIQAQQDWLAGEKMKMNLANQAALARLDGIKRERAELEISHKERLQQIQETGFENEEQYQQAMDLEKELYDAEVKRFEKQHNAGDQLMQDFQDIEKAGVQAFAQGLSTAIVDAFEEGDKAFQKFASNFLKQISQMIMQALILRAIQATGIFPAAQGGQFPAKYAAGGISEIYSPTYFPRFNVIAGEAGREMMTVLARPRFERINGIPAQVGMAAGRRLAITSADALANAGGAGAGGTIRVIVQMEPGLVGNIQENSVKGAVAQVVTDLHNDTNISRGVRKLAT